MERELIFASEGLWGLSVFQGKWVKDDLCKKYEYYVHVRKEAGLWTHSEQMVSKRGLTKAVHT